MIRILFFLATMLTPIFFSWWLFIPLAFLFVLLVRPPYEIVLAGFVLDSVYYFGEGFFMNYALTLFSAALALLAFFLSKKIYWPRAA